MHEPRRIWWARPRKLCALERPGGGGRSHRPERRATEIEYLRAKGVRTVVSTMPTRHNLSAYDEAGLEWLHVPGEDEETLEALVPILRTRLRRPGAVAVHGDYRTDFVAAVCAACLYDAYGVSPDEALARAAAAGLDVTPEAAALIGAVLTPA
ncbi:MAG TPA: hypothetical protein VD790_12395 [Thermoleophilaceae bacterium]|nr:hypothetical protein [Thermoleophilaceae bacterium]